MGDFRPVERQIIEREESATEPKSLGNEVLSDLIVEGNTFEDVARNRGFSIKTLKRIVGRAVESLIERHNKKKE